MTGFYKLIRAEEKIWQLHPEVQGLITNMFNEEKVILDKAEEVKRNNLGLALQLQSYWNKWGKFNNLYRRRLFAIKRLPGFQPKNLCYFCQGTHVSKRDVSMGPEGPN